MLRDIVGNDRADRRARFAALNVIALREGGSGRRWLPTVSRDPLMMPAMRVEAAAVLGRSSDRAEALDLLAELATDDALSRRWRWSARIVRLVTRADPAIRPLLEGPFLTDKLRELVWDRVDRLLRRDR
jgi:hypothetical protein